MVIRRDASLDVNFKLKPPRVQDILFNKDRNLFGQIMDYNDYYGFIIVEYQSGKRKRYSALGGLSVTFRYATKEECADYRLAQANSRSDDSWRE